jgi:hypothetical protein
MERLIIFGDSFGVQKTPELFNSWVTLLDNHYEIENQCECGVSQYKILQRLKNTDLTKFDKILITHTSPTRVYVKDNPLHKNSEYHKNCDILFADIENHVDEFSVACKLYFKHIFDFDYAFDIHNMICQEIDKLCGDKNTIHMTNFDYTNLYFFPNLINFYPLFLKNKGEVNHYNEVGNNKIYQTLLTELSK